VRCAGAELRRSFADRTAVALALNPAPIGGWCNLTGEHPALCSEAQKSKLDQQKSRLNQHKSSLDQQKSREGSGGHFARKYDAESRGWWMQVNDDSSRAG
jgi:hypothetical protein